MLKTNPHTDPLSILTRDNCSNIPEPDYEESHSLHQQIQKEMIFPIKQIIYCTVQHKHSHQQLQDMNPVSTATGLEHHDLFSVWEDRKVQRNHLSTVLDLGFFKIVKLFFSFIVFPSFSVTTHSLTRFASRSPMIAALVRWSDMTFSNKIQKTTRCSDLPQKVRGFYFNLLLEIKE